MLKLKKKDLVPVVFNAENKAIQFKVDLRTVRAKGSIKARLVEIHHELRTLLRCNTNLEKCSLALEDLKRVRDPKTKVANGLRNEQPIFAFAIIQYGACFVVGESKKRPLDYLPKRIQTSKAHKEMKVFRDKLFGHIDKNHKVRSDFLNWTLILKENKLVPHSGDLTGEYIHMPSLFSVKKWQKHVSLLREKICKRKIELTSEVNQALADIAVIE